MMLLIHFRRSIPAGRRAQKNRRSAVRSADAHGQVFAREKPPESAQQRPAKSERTNRAFSAKRQAV